VFNYALRPAIKCFVVHLGEPVARLPRKASEIVAPTGTGSLNDWRFSISPPILTHTQKNGGQRLRELLKVSRITLIWLAGGWVYAVRADPMRFPLNCAASSW